MKSVKDIIKGRRLELGLTMKELAKRVGVNEGTISRWESGEIANMRRGAIFELAKALEISPSSLMGWSNEEKSNHKQVEPSSSVILARASKELPLEQLKALENMAQALLNTQTKKKD
ncbi:helix-turn-helix domain-containing protein [Pectinatus frisingensis]|uniref:helix-turn-helix domain-containing protein n=1 Tax=Pectinatus frisingensis TaxID=865 RepID=UPI0018C69667|nr:helix-turn-helix transcriptional regulator [Pectinatus frisingensis]